MSQIIPDQLFLLGHWSKSLSRLVKAPFPKLKTKKELDISKLQNDKIDDIGKLLNVKIIGIKVKHK